MLVVISLILMNASVQAADDAIKFGAFLGPLDLRFNSDGRTAVLLAPFGYVDPAGKKWETPADWTVDGASIPWPLWSIIGSPWTGKYREASVIHDYYCDTKREPWAAIRKT